MKILDTDGHLYGPEFPPRLDDMFLQLGQIKRFGGRGLPSFQAKWSVLHHSLLVAWLADGAPVAHLGRAALVHDLFEVFTGDIPTPFKPDAIREMETDFLERWFPGLPHGDPFLKQCDRNAAKIEASCLWPAHPETVREHFGDFKVDASHLLMAYSLAEADVERLANLAVMGFETPSFISWEGALKGDYQ